MKTTPDEMVANLDKMITKDSVFLNGNIVLSKPTFDLLVPVWGKRFRFGSELYPTGLRRDFRGWLSTPKGDRQIWIGFIEDGQVAFRRKLSEVLLF